MIPQTEAAKRVGLNFFVLCKVRDKKKETSLLVGRQLGLGESMLRWAGKSGSMLGHSLRGKNEKLFAVFAGHV